MNLRSMPQLAVTAAVLFLNSALAAESASAPNTPEPNRPIPAPVVLNPDDVRAMAVPVLAHRIQMETKAKYGGLLPQHVIEEMLEKTPVPR